MSSSARHARKKNPLRTSALLRAGLTVTAAGAVVTGAGGAAVADDVPQRAASPSADSAPDSGTSQERPSASAALAPGKLDGTSALETSSEALAQGVDSSLGGALGPVKKLQLNPLAKTGVDPLDNALATQVADFKPVSTAAVTGPLAEGASLEELPVVGDAVDLLPG